MSTTSSTSSLVVSNINALAEKKKSGGGSGSGGWGGGGGGGGLVGDGGVVWIVWTRGTKGHPQRRGNHAQLTTHITLAYTNSDMHTFSCTHPFFPFLPLTPSPFPTDPLQISSDGCVYLLRELASLAGQGLRPGSGLGQGLRPGLVSEEQRSETGQGPELGPGGSGLDIGGTVDTYLEKV